MPERFSPSTLAVLVAAAVVFLVGCAAQPSLIGTWQGRTSGVDITTEFKADKTFLSEGGQGELEVKVTGTYKLESEKLTMTTDEVKLKGVPKALEAQVKAAIPKEQVANAKFLSNDELELEQDGMKEVWTRKKE